MNKQEIIEAFEEGKILYVRFGAGEYKEIKKDCFEIFDFKEDTFAIKPKYWNKENEIRVVNYNRCKLDRGDLECSFIERKNGVALSFFPMMHILNSSDTCKTEYFKTPQGEECELLAKKFNCFEIYVDNRLIKRFDFSRTNYDYARQICLELFTGRLKVGDLD